MCDKLTGQPALTLWARTDGAAWAQLRWFCCKWSHPSRAAQWGGKNDEGLAYFRRSELQLSIWNSREILQSTHTHWIEKLHVKGKRVEDRKVGRAVEQCLFNRPGRVFSPAAHLCKSGSFFFTLCKIVRFMRLHFQAKPPPPALTTSISGLVSVSARHTPSIYHYSVEQQAQCTTGSR